MHGNNASLEVVRSASWTVSKDKEKSIKIHFIYNTAGISEQDPSELLSDTGTLQNSRLTYNTTCLLFGQVLDRYVPSKPCPTYSLQNSFKTPSKLILDTDFWPVQHPFKIPVRHIIWLLFSFFLSALYFFSDTAWHVT